TRSPVAPTTSSPPLALAALPPLTSYAAIAERPLFTPSRRVSSSAAATTLGPSIESRYRLLGIVVTGPKKKAFFAEGARRSEVAEGDILDGWRVKEIGRDRVRLTSPSGEATLVLKPSQSEPQKPQ
ncbi:MAG TPA: hypothetical protein VM782_08175, partial [Stellaceae bacterium]|nr:hypothetical protein [Stellaceae bacterium]